MLLLTAFLLASPAGGMPWIHDDFTAAQAASRETKRPIVIDFWAPWCHTCLSMKKTVLTRAELGAQVDEFVWLSVDTDRPENEALVERFPPSFWPTFLVIDADGAIIGRHAGAATTIEFKALLTDARQRESVLIKALTKADNALAQRDFEVAASLYAAVLAYAPSGWSRRPNVLVSAITALRKTEDWPRCLSFAAAHLADATQGGSASAADFSYFAGACADQVGGPLALSMRYQAILAVRATLDAKPNRLSADDRSDALRLLRAHAVAVGDEAQAGQAALEQVSVLDAAIAADPELVLMAAWPRAEVYHYLGRAEELIPELEAASALHPRAYDPPYRLAWVLFKSGRLDEAIPPTLAAAKNAYGPRRAQVFKLLAQIHEARSDQSAERDAWRHVITTLDALPEHQRSASRRAEAAERLAALK